MLTGAPLTVHNASRMLSRREVSSVELTQICLDRIQQCDGRVRAFITVTPELALQQAEEADRRIAAGSTGPLTGVPMQVKDLICTQGVATTCASRMLEDYVPVYNATVAEKLLGQGAVLLGKGNMDEFGMGSSCENSAFFPTRNPWDLERVPGGSSGGGAAAVAAGEAMYAIGTDTGGSIRQPSAMCGAVGLKPTYGLVSRYGLIAYASSLDQIGPITRDITDSALLLNAIAGPDPRDSTCLDVPAVDYTDGLTVGTSAPLGSVGTSGAVRLGVPEEYFTDGMEPGVQEAIETAIDTLASLGADVETVSLPTTRYALACYYVIAPSECSANLARYDGVKYGYSFQDTDNMWEAMEQTRGRGFGPEVKRRIMLGAYALSAGYYDAYYLKAQQVRTLIRHEFDRVFQQVDALVTPTSPVVAFPLGSKTADPVEMYLIDVCTLPVTSRAFPPSPCPAASPRACRWNAANRAPPFRATVTANRTCLRAGDGVAQGMASYVTHSGITVERGSNALYRDSERHEHLSIFA